MFILFLLKLSMDRIERVPAYDPTDTYTAA